MASSAVYRYFASRDELLTALIVETYDTVGEAAEQRRRAGRVRRSRRDGWRSPSRSAAGPSPIRTTTRSCTAARCPATGRPRPRSHRRSGSAWWRCGSSTTACRRARSRRRPPTMPMSSEPCATTSSGSTTSPRSTCRPDVLARGLIVWTHLFGTISFELFGHLHNVIHDYDAFFESQTERAIRFLVSGDGSRPLRRSRRSVPPIAPVSPCSSRTRGTWAVLASSPGSGSKRWRRRAAGSPPRSAGATTASTRDEALAHAAALVGATELPVSADLENCFADDPAGAADTVTKAVAIGLAGCSIEDFTGDPANPIYDIGLATERVAAAAEAAHREGGLRAHRSSREPPPRHPGSRRHDHSAAAVLRRPAPTCSTRRRSARSTTSVPS